MADLTDTTKPRVVAFLEGGGVKGAALVGALVEAASHVDIVGVGGSSAGAIVAALYVAGYTPAELRTLMLELDYKRLAKRLWWPKRFGLCSSEYLYQWIRNRLSEKVLGTPDQQVTFSHIPMPLKILAAAIRNRELLVFCRDDCATCEVATAVRMSMSIPFVFETITEGARQVVDGGVISNLPLWLFDRERQGRAAGVGVLGFDLVGAPCASRPITSLGDYAVSLVTTVMDANRRLLEERQSGRQMTSIIRIPTGTIAATDCGLSVRDVRWLYSQGRRAARNFFATQSLAWPKKLVRTRPRAPTGALAEAMSAHTPTLKSVLAEVVADYVCHGGVAQNAGTYEEVLVKYYVDLMEAALDYDVLQVLATCAAAFIGALDLGQFDVVVGPKMRNPLLAAGTAQRIGKPCVLVKDVFTPRGGYPFDGSIRAGQHTILRDDVASDGVFLSRAVHSLRSQGARVTRVVALVERKEGNARRVLEEQGCYLDTILQLSDADIEELTAFTAVSMRG